MPPPVVLKYWAERMSKTTKPANPLSEYNKLVREVEAVIGRVRQCYPRDIACQRGCDHCCRLTSAFAVEAYEIRRLFEQLSLRKRMLVRGRIRRRASRCIFLYKGECLVYDVRPIICRTHGYPLLVDGRPDFCPRNFQKRKSIKADCLLDLEKLTLRLAAVNLNFLFRLGKAKSTPRYKLKEIVKSGFEIGE